jgi:hypothetical protein
MLWKLLGLQKKLDALFDEGWNTLGFACNFGGPGSLSTPNAKFNPSHR